MLEKINKFPPIACRLSARHGKQRRWLNDSEIARRSGLSRKTIATLSNSIKWDGSSVDTVEAFRKGCGDINLLHPRRHIEYLRRMSKRNLPPEVKVRLALFARLAMEELKSKTETTA